MTPKKQPPRSPQKRSRSEARHEDVDRSRKVTRRSTASAQANTIPRSPPHTPPPVGREEVSIRHSIPLSTCSAPIDPKSPLKKTPSTPQSLVKRVSHVDDPTIEREITRPIPPIVLSKHAWAPRHAVKINRHSFNTTTNSPSASSKGTRWVEVLGQVSRMYHYKRVPDDQVRFLLVKPGTFDEQINA